MQEKNIERYKIRGKLTIIQFMSILGAMALLITLVLSYFIA